jgi:hypothetical protein
MPGVAFLILRFPAAAENVRGIRLWYLPVAEETPIYVTFSHFWIAPCPSLPIDLAERPMTTT